MDQLIHRGGATNRRQTPTSDGGITARRGTPPPPSAIDDYRHIFTSEDLDDLATTLAETGEIDTRYSYLGGGASTWDRYVNRLDAASAPNILHGTRAVAEANIRARLGPEAPLEFHHRDFTRDPLADLHTRATLVLLAGGTLMNIADPVAVLRHVREVAGVLAFVGRADTGVNRTFSHFREAGTGDDMPERYRSMLDHLGVQRDEYEPEFGFDAIRGERYLRIRLIGPATFAGRLTLPAGSRVQLWRYYHRSTEELIAMLDAAGFALLTVRHSPDREFVLTAGS